MFLIFFYVGKWTVEALSSALEAQPSAVRRHVGFWVSQGVLKEKPTDTFTVIEQQRKGTASALSHGNKIHKGTD